MPPAQAKYKYAVIATDVVILTVRNNQLQVLLMKMQKAPYLKHWAVPGGLVKPRESVDNAARRNLNLKAGIKNVYLEQLYTFGRVDRDPFGRVVSVAYYALVAESNIQLAPTEYQVAWWPVKKLPSLAYDHQEIVAKAISRLQAKLEYTNIVYSLLPTEFTLTDLQKTYEIILGHKLDKRNFRKKIMAVKLVRPTKKQIRGGAFRPATLYVFTHRSPHIVSII